MLYIFLDIKSEEDVEFFYNIYDFYLVVRDESLHDILIDVDSYIEVDLDTLIRKLTMCVLKFGIAEGRWCVKVDSTSIDFLKYLESGEYHLFDDDEDGKSYLVDKLKFYLKTHKVIE